MTISSHCLSLHKNKTSLKLKNLSVHNDCIKKLKLILITRSSLVNNSINSVENKNIKKTNLDKIKPNKNPVYVCYMYVCMLEIHAYIESMLEFHACILYLSYILSLVNIFLLLWQYIGHLLVTFFKARKTCSM